MKRDRAAAAGRGLLLLVLVASATYLMLYLYRWEWQRAIISGIFFLAALIVLVTVVVLRRLEALARSGTLAASPYAGTGPGASGGYRAEPGEGVPSFPWLEPRNDYGVFIPILLGFGVMVGVLAVVVERLASFVGGGVGVQELAPVGRVPDRHQARSRSLRRLGVVLVGGGLLIALLVVLRALTMYVPDPPRPGERVIAVTLTDRRIDAAVAPTTEAMVQYCIAATGAPIQQAQVRTSGGNEATISLRPRLDESTQRRLNGCLEDAILDRRLLKIDSIEDRAP